MRKVSALLLALLIALATVVPAMAAEPIPGVYQLITVDQYGNEVVTGTAVLMFDQSTMLTTRWALPEADVLYARGPGGNLPMNHGQSLTAGSELAVFMLDQPAADTPLVICASGWEGVTLCGATASGEIVSMPVTHLGETSYLDTDCLLVTAQAGLLPGSVLLNAEGKIAGVAMAAWGEGEGRYVVYPMEAIYQELKDEEEGASLPDGTSWISPVSYLFDDGRCIISWADAAIEGLSEDSVITVFFTDTQNRFYSYLTPTDPSITEVSIGFVPGRSYYVWVQHAHGETVHTQFPQGLRIDVPAAAPFNAFDYKDVAFYLGSTPAGEPAVGGKFVPELPEISAVTLNDDATDVYMQVESVYDVNEQISTSLIVSLKTPEGYMFLDDSGGFIFDPSLCESDIWQVNISPLLRQYLNLNNGTFAPGEYELVYYLGGYPANRIVFTLP